MHQSRGNILFLILLAVVLFAALAYAVTSSMRGGGQSAAGEQMTLFASQLLQNASLIENTITRAQLVNNIPDWGFDFYHSSYGSTKVANATCTQPACKIYSGNGGDIPFFTVPPKMAIGGATAGMLMPGFHAVQVIDIGSPAPDIIITWQYISLDACKAINKALGLDNLNLTPVDAINGTNTIYDGTLTATPASTGVIGDTNAALKGKKAACYSHISDTATYGYRFHYVLMER